MLYPNYKTLLLVLSFTSLGILNAQSSQEDELGYQLLKNKCYICHNTGSSHDNMLAPPMMAVKNHYWEEDKSTFIKNIVDWVLEPTEEKVQMYGAVNRFKMMPKLAYNKEDLEKIAAYMYDHEMEPPSFCGSTQEVKQVDPLEGLTLNNGSKWIVNKATDEGMRKIKSLLTEYVKNDGKDHVDLALKMSYESSNLINKCHMVGKDHDQLHIVLAPILDSIEEIKNTENVQPLLNLSVYLAAYFEHFTVN